MLGIDRKIDLSKLPTAEGASFSSHIEEHNARCLADTRVELQDRIAKWAYNINGECILWLNGMAGSGKSTIARTMARAIADVGRLGASFFFKKGEGDRGNATRFFTTIASQLATSVPALIPRMRKAIDADSNISEKSLKDQFEKLILLPLSEIKQASLQPSVLVVIIDALDECEREEDIRVILQLLARAKEVGTVHLRLLVTSRPELPIRLGFKQLPGMYQDLILHEVPKAIIEHDISVFLKYELGKIREERSLSSDWPSNKDVHTLVEMATPLFIFAATVCRFVADPKASPKRRLNTVLSYQTGDEVSKLDKTYLPILSQLFAEQDKVEQKRLAEEFREVVGPIVVLASPLSVISLSSILSLPEDEIACRLDLLHSVLNIPSDRATPVRLLHLSFRDFLLDPKKSGKFLFWVDDREVHERLANKCITLLLRSKHLKRDICNLQKPGTKRDKIDGNIIERSLPPDI
jgi:hypothetical protein